MAIKSKSELLQRGYEIDLTGPDGNAFALRSHACNIGRQLGYTEDRIRDIIKTMMMSNYENLLNVFEAEFGHLVTMYR